MITELNIREYVRRHNDVVQAQHEERERRAVQALSEMEWKPEQMEKFQDVVGAIGVRLAAVMARKPKLITNRLFR